MKKQKATNVWPRFSDRKEQHSDKASKQLQNYPESKSLPNYMYVQQFHEQLKLVCFVIFIYLFTTTFLTSCDRMQR